MTQRTLIDSGSPWESRVGYSRAVKVGDWVLVSGTTTLNPDGTVFAPGDTGRQTREILARIASALDQAGSAMDDVVRVRIYVTNLVALTEMREELITVFRAIRPAMTLVQVAGLIHPGLVVEIEGDALLGSGEAA